MLLHPVPVMSIDDESRRAEIESLAHGALRAIAPTMSAEIIGADIELPIVASPPTAEAIERRRLITDASGLEGYFFCGPEALIGAGISLSAGRRAAERALRYFRSGGPDG